MTTTHNTSTCRIERTASRCALEFAAFAWPARAVHDPHWPSAPGAVRYDAQQRPALLHFAPGRWLAPDPSAETRSLLEGVVRQAPGTVVDVTGKWDALMISGPGAHRLLACAISIEAVLDGRDCAAVTLFDCPATLARVQGQFALWVQSSYTTDFLHTAERFRASLEGIT